MSEAMNASTTVAGFSKGTSRSAFSTIWSMP
jgi:hypothetical protein